VIYEIYVPDIGRTIPIPIPYANLKMIKNVIFVAMHERIPKIVCKIAFHLINCSLPY